MPGRGEIHPQPPQAMNRAKHKERTERIQETGGKLRGGTNGNVWEWGPQSWREDALMEQEDDLFDAIMDHCESIVLYEAELKQLRDLLAKATSPA